MSSLVFNIDFLVASLAFLLVILYHFRQQRNMDLSSNTTFLWLIGLGILNILFNIICTVLITLHRPGLAVVMEVCLVLHFSLQILVANGLLSHVFRQFSHSVISSRKRYLFCVWLPLFWILLILSNHWTNLFFTVSSAGAYTRGPWYLVIYAAGGSYLILTTLCCRLHKDKLSNKQYKAIWELVILSGLTVLFQSWNHDVLLIGFGITLGIMVLFFTLNNPFQYTDSVTSVFDIRYFRERCQNNIVKEKNFHLLTVEISRLKQINRVLGASMGNRLLAQTAQMLLTGDKENLVFRISGKRLSIITYSVLQYEEMRAKIMSYFQDPVVIGDHEVKIATKVCGILNCETLKDSDEILGYVQYLLSLVPQSYDYQIVQGDEDSLRGFHNQQMIESYLETAIEQDLFTVAYQPVYSLKEKKYVSCEALSRLTHPTLGPVSPDIFIRLAEKNDKIAKIGLMQLRRVCRFIKENPEILTSLHSMKFNLSPAELMRSGHADQLIRIIQESGVPTSFFQFEITETVATEYCRSLTQIAQKFASHGIRLCLDDFGSGFANLNSVFKMPFSVIKLDRSLLFDICRDSRAAALYRGLISSMHIMDFTVLAEGVETEEELNMVSGCGVDMIQGFYFSRPVSGDVLLKEIREMNNSK